MIRTGDTVVQRGKTSRGEVSAPAPLHWTNLHTKQSLCGLVVRGSFRGKPAGIAGQGVCPTCEVVYMNRFLLNNNNAQEG